MTNMFKITSLVKLNLFCRKANYDLFILIIKIKRR